MSRFLVWVFVFLISGVANAQLTPIGQWRDLLNFSNVQKLAMADDRIYAAGNSGLFFVDQRDNSLNRLSTINGLSDINATGLNAPADGNHLFIGYETGVFDIIDGSNIFTVSDISRSQLIGNKQVNHFNFFNDSVCYISTGFGIVQYNALKREISETFFIGPNGSNVFVNQTVIHNDTMYALTQEGLYRASMQDFLFVPSNWSKDLSFPEPNADLRPGASFGGNLLINVPRQNFQSDTVYSWNGGTWSVNVTLSPQNNNSFEIKNNRLLVANSGSFEVYDTSWTNVRREFTSNDKSISPNYAIFGTGNDIWFGDFNLGLIKNQAPFQNIEYFIPGPSSNKAFRLNVFGNRVYVSAGQHNEIQIRSAQSAQVSIFESETWRVLDQLTVPGMDTITDIIFTSQHPREPQRFAGASMSVGLVLFNEDKISTIYSLHNSPLKGIQGSTFATYVTGVDYDDNGVLWLTNDGVALPLHALKPDGSWKSFEVGNTDPQMRTNQVLATPWGHIWFIAPGKGISILDYNQTIDDTTDDRYLTLFPAVGRGNLPGDPITSMKLDYDGHIWVGSNAGLRVIYNAERILDRDDIDANDIFINQDGQTQILLENQYVTDFYIDPANRKWISTRGNGVYLMSPDGSSEVHHFTKENSPLYTDDVNSIGVDESTGEVWFATEEGIIAYRGSATQSATFTEIIAYPNPVPPKYTGLIGISGIADQSSVIITDVAGNKVFETTSSGGQATWDGRDFFGNKVTTGVYLIYAASPDGRDRGVAKILIEN